MSNRSPYPLSETNTGFSFTTDRGTIYEVVFRDDIDYFSDQSFLGPVFSFAVVHVGGEIGPKDSRIELTVADVLLRAFTADPYTIISYTCSTENRQGFQRSIMFRRWFRKNGTGYLMLDYENQIIHEYSAVIYKENHPQGTDIKRVFTSIFHQK